MKIAELFVALGFDIKGDDKLLGVERNMTKASGASVQLLAGVSALNIAFYAMISTAAEAAVSLQKFAWNTGLSSEELQRWQRAGQAAGIQGDEMIKTLTALQTAQKNVMLGQGDFSPFQFFGLSVGQDPFDQLKTLNAKFQTMDPAFARIMASRLGISENLFQWLRRDNLELDKFNEKLLLTNQQQKALWSLNKTWQDLLFSLSALKNKIAETFEEPLERAAKLIKEFVLLGADFLDWLNGTSIAANITKTALIFLVAGLGALLVMLTALTAVLGAVTIAVKLLALGLIPLAIDAAPFLLVIGLMLVGLAVLVFLIQDFWVACRGGKTAFDWSEGLILTVKNVERLAKAIEWVIDLFEKMDKAQKDHKTLAIVGNLLMPGAGLLLPMMAGNGGGKTTNQENNVKIDVHGAGDPAAVGRGIVTEMQRSINQASGNLRQREY